MDLIPDAPPFSVVPGMLQGVFGLGDTLPADARGSGSDALAPTGFLFHLWTVDLVEHVVPLVAACDLGEAAVEAQAACADRCARAVEEHEASAEPAPPAPCNVFLTGHTPDGVKVGIVTRFFPTCVVELPSADDTTTRWFKNDVLPALAWSLRIQPHQIGVHFHMAPHWLGYEPDADNPCQRARFPMATLSFPNTKLMQRAGALLRHDHGRGLVLRRGPSPPPGRKDPFALDRADVDLRHAEKSHFLHPVLRYFDAAACAGAMGSSGTQGSAGSGGVEGGVQMGRAREGRDSTLRRRGGRGPSPLANRGCGPI